jgi:hypothetical protein
VRDLKGAGRRQALGDARNGNAGLNWESRQPLPDKTSSLHCQLAIEHAVTTDMDDGQPLPPFIEDRIVWHVVRRADGRTIWRRLYLKTKPSHVAAGAQRRET